MTGQKNGEVSSLSKLLLHLSMTHDMAVTVCVHQNCGIGTLYIMEHMDEEVVTDNQRSTASVTVNADLKHLLNNMNVDRWLWATLTSL